MAQQEYKASRKYTGVRQVKGSASWSYRFKVVVNGQEISREQSGFSTALEASEARARAIEELKSQGYMTNYGKKISEIYPEWVKSLEKSRDYETIRKHKSIYTHHMYPAFGLRYMNISSLSDTPDRKKSDTLTAKILHPFRIDGAWRPHGLRTAATPLDHSEIAFSRLMDSPLMVST